MQRIDSKGAVGIRASSGTLLREFGDSVTLQLRVNCDARDATLPSGAELALAIQDLWIWSERDRIAPAPRQRLDSKVSAFLVYRTVAAPPKALQRSKGTEHDTVDESNYNPSFRADAAARYFSRLLCRAVPQRLHA